MASASSAADTVVYDLVDSIKADARSQLLDLLDEITGRKVLMLDRSLVGPLDLIVHPSDLKDHGVQNLHKLGEKEISSDCSQMIFLARCTRPELMDYIATQILADEKEGLDRMYQVVLIPRKSEQCLERLGRNNVLANVRIVEYALNFFPYDRDVLSIEAPGAFRDFHVQGDPSTLFFAARSLMAMQEKFGVIPAVHAIGNAAKAVLDTMQRLRREAAIEAQHARAHRMPSREPTQQGVPPIAPHAQRLDDTGSFRVPKISEVVLIDRRVDLYSVLCSQFTYQALIDHVFGIQNNSADLSSTEWAKERTSHVRMTPDDPLVQEVKDLHIDKLGPLLQQRAMAIQETYKEKDNVKNPSEMQEYIKKFKTAQSAHPLLEIHINLASHLKSVIQNEDYRSQLRIEDDITTQSTQTTLETLEDFMDDLKPIHETLRLLCLHSLVNNGIKPKQLDVLKKLIVQTYGYEHLLTLCNLDRVGMLRYHQGKSLWPGIKRHFNLFVEDSAAERDLSYAYCGYAPLSARLVEFTKSRPNGWRSCQDALSLLWGPAQDLRQPAEPGTTEEPQDPNMPSVVLVCFLGGVTYGEIAALRRLSELEEGRRKFLIVTTEFINHKKLFESLRPEQVKQAPEPVETKEAKTAKAPEQKKPSGGFGFFGR
eukprot:TRINITY_DN62452_c0_g1_i1.p1 TRINITY_DN62452_c0_g1~~TRINITY_DN62452_c0_g1_i1.p1  ORF type:complete len:688 (+),score=96.20 TRINITY_DN62452_c0_g1_i1:109-2064(+)